ncbi:MarR family winged helix-turn-helix transcriptional regulator [Lacticaseibacillus kribbianus]|uniref:MarR family winged helix-turn-helix transcriptional regulator n=1 Tax=Lacticaseibacillus kribbianus TaxID=2926292 RepID=UPI001CD2E39E|nr:MarR family winged helix-turn-helix transcriptional regulator [Lacticaseibacillus kribbianus]
MPEYGKLLKHAANQMARGMDAYARQFGLTGVQMSIIDYLADHPDALQRDIEGEFNIQRSSATLLLQRMERAGLVERRQAASDGRQKTVALTAKAQELQHGVSAYISAQQAAMTEAFTPEELALFVTMLTQFTQITGSDITHD